MKATEAKLLDFLKKSPQFVIPIYQRSYCWTEKECKQLWDDIIRTGSDDNISVHFVGSIVYIEKDDGTVTTWEPLLVIDGQQRLTTVTLLLTALANVKGESNLIDGFSPEMVRGYYLHNSLEKGEKQFKLILSQTDKTSLIAIVNNQEQPSDFSYRITENFKLFENLIANQKGDLSSLCKGLAKLLMVDVKLKRGEDNPQLIFESMNSLGKELSEADLIRNYILMGLDPEFQTRLYEQFWRPIELDFGQEAYGEYFDAFMRHYLTVKTGEIPNINAVYDTFKEYSRLSRTKAVDDKSHIEELIHDIRDYAKYYCAMVLGAENDHDLKLAFHDLRELKVDVAYPFLLELYHDYKIGTLSKDDFLATIRMTESYVFRRAICAIPTNSMNKTFANFSKSINKDKYLESIKANFLILPSYRRFPSDEEFHRDLQTRDLYNFRSCNYWLRRLENFDRKERVEVNEYTIEHIMPQNKNLSSQWINSLGEDWQRIQETWLHTLGNLTLTAYNSEFSDRPFLEKRDMPNSPEKGLRQSPLKLNQGLGMLEEWNEDTIKNRANKLAGIAVGVWTSPVLPKDVLDVYRPKDDIKAEYDISDHPYLINGSDMYGKGVKDLFEALRKEILAIDPCVTETFLKLYVAYKAETNFVDIVPQAKQLRLALNVKFAEINDAKSICRDVSGLGRWGNGDVEVSISKMEEIPYVMGLIRQVFDKQQGELI